MLTCRICNDDDRDDWQRFVAQHTSWGLYHDFAWKQVVERAYGHHTLYLIASDDGRVVGVLPLVLIRSRIFGSSITSLPYVDFAGVVATSESGRDALVAEAERLATEARIAHIEFRQRERLPGEFSTATHKVLMTLDLPSEEELMWKALSSERRNRVRRASKSGLSVEIADRSKLPVFYDIWTRNMRDLGSPPHSLRFFDEIMSSFGDLASLMLVRADGRYVGAAFAMRSGETMSVPWVSSLREHFQLYPNNILYWEAIRYAISQGCKVFDFGRSSVESGTYRFKQRWGAVPAPLYWQSRPADTQAESESSDEGKFGIAVRVWKYLPVGLTRLIGPSLRRMITA